MTAAVLTIDEGLRKAVAQNKRDVYVSAGAFNGPLAITNLAGKNIAGGYQPGPLRWTSSSRRLVRRAHGASTSGSKRSVKMRRRQSAASQRKRLAWSLSRTVQPAIGRSARSR